MEEKLASTQQQLEDSTRLMEAGDLRTSTAELPEGGAVTVFSSENEQLIRLSPRDVGAAPAGKSLQMWVIGTTRAPESVGLMTGEPVTSCGAELHLKQSVRHHRGTRGRIRPADHRPDRGHRPVGHRLPAFLPEPETPRTESPHSQMPRPPATV